MVPRPDSEPDWPSTHSLYRTIQVSIGARVPLSAAISPPNDTLYIIAVGEDPIVHQFFLAHVMLHALSVPVYTVHGAELLSLVARCWTKNFDLETSKMFLFSPTIYATGAKTKRGNSRLIVICHRPICFILIRATVQWGAAVHGGLHWARLGTHCPIP